MTHLRGLDGIRFISAIWVMIAHCLIWGGYFGSIPDAKLAVAVFMILSGYLMAHTARDFSRPHEWGRFYLKRFFRIAPLYYVVLLFIAASPWVVNGFAAWQRFPPGSFYDPANADFSPGNLLLHLTFLFGLSGKTATTTTLPDWSLSLEMQFYAVFPLVWLAVNRWGALRVCSLLTLACLPWFALDRREWFDPSHLGQQLPYFLAGIVAFEARNDVWLMPLASLIAGFEVPLYHWWTLVPVSGVGLVYAFNRYPTFAPDFKHLRLGGDISYGIYLTHGMFIAAGAGLPLWQLIPFVTACTFLLSYLLHIFIERPGIRLGRNMSFLSARKTQKESPDSLPM